MDNEELDIQELLGLGEKPVKKKKVDREHANGTIHGLVDRSHSGTKLWIINGKFILLKGSRIVLPVQDCLEKSHFERNMRVINKLRDGEKLAGGNGVYILKEDLECTSSSAAGSFVVGKRSSGLSLFEGVTEVHKMYNQNKNISKFED